MKRILLGLLVICLLAGCNDVTMSPAYSAELDVNAAITAVIADRAEAGLLTPAEMVRALRAHADAWQKFRDARDGVAGK